MISYSHRREHFGQGCHRLFGFRQTVLPPRQAGGGRYSGDETPAVLVSSIWKLFPCHWNWLDKCDVLSKVLLYFCLKSLALVHKSGPIANWFARARLCTMQPSRHALPDAAVQKIGPFSKRAHASRKNNVVVSARYVIIYLSASWRR